MEDWHGVGRPMDALGRHSLVTASTCEAETRGGPALGPLGPRWVVCPPSPFFSVFLQIDSEA